MPGAPAGAAESFFSGKSATMHSVVKTIPAIEAAFCNPERVTFAGSTIPAVSYTHLTLPTTSMV